MIDEKILNILKEESNEREIDLDRVKSSIKALAMKSTETGELFELIDNILKEDKKANLLELVLEDLQTFTGSLSLEDVLYDIDAKTMYVVCEYGDLEPLLYDTELCGKIEPYVIEAITDYANSNGINELISNIVDMSDDLIVINGNVIRFT